MAITSQGQSRVDSLSSDGLPQPRRTGAAIAIWLAVALSILDQTIANVALPTIADQLHTSPTQAIWVVNAYQIAIVMTLLPVASLADIVGHRRVYVAGIALFVVASLSCVLAGGLVSLSVSRFVQGLGASALMAVNGSLVRFTYPRAILGRGIGYNALVIAIGSASGPSIAAAILSLGSWRWLFAINVPIGLLSIALGLRFLPDVVAVPHRFDRRAAILNAASFALLFLGANSIAHGGSIGLGLVELVTAVASFVLVARHARADPAPLIPTDLLRIPLLRLSYATSSCSFAAQAMAFVTLPFLFLARFGYSHVTTGFMLTAWPLATAMAAPVSGRLVERVSASVLGGIGLIATAAGLLVLALLPPGAPTASIIAALALAGGGFGLFQTPNNRTMLGVAPAARAGAASGMQATARLVGQTSAAVAVGLMFRLLSTASPVPLFTASALAAFACFFSLRRRGLA